MQYHIAPGSIVAIGWMLLLIYYGGTNRFGDLQ